MAFMTVFARRSIQRQVDELSNILTEEQVKALVGRLNQENSQSLAAEWEVFVLCALSNLGNLQHEVSAGGPSRADVVFNARDDPSARFAADITCVSDDSALKHSPVEEFMELVRRRASKLGITGGGFYF